MGLNLDNDKEEPLVNSFEAFQASWFNRPSIFRFKPAKVTGEIYAILIGIDRYGYGMLGKEFNGCLNDVHAWQDLLSPSYPIASISSLLDTKATKVAIVEVLKNTMSHLRPQDTLLFAFSGHAHNRDYPHALATYDSIAAQRETYLSETEFRDIIASFESINPFVVMILDTHAGSSGWIDVGNNKHVLLAASASYQLSKEVSGQGLFTTALQTTLESNEEQVSYRKLMRDACVYTKKLSLEQLPQLFGHTTSINQAFLGGSMDQTTYINELLHQTSYQNIETVLKDFNIDDQETEIIRTLGNYSILNGKEKLKVVRISSEMDVQKIPIFRQTYLKKLPYQIEIEDIVLLHTSDNSGLKDGTGTEPIEDNLSILKDAQLIIFILNPALLYDFHQHSSIMGVINYMSHIENKIVCSILWEECDWLAIDLKNYPVFSIKSPLMYSSSGYEVEIEIKTYFSNWKPVREKWAGDLLKEKFYSDDLKYYNPPREIEKKGRKLEYDINLTLNESWSFFNKQLQNSEILVGRYQNQAPADVAAHIYSRGRMKEIEKTWWPIEYYAVDILIFQGKEKSIKKVFISYSKVDSQYFSQAQKFLKNLERENLIEIWHDGLLKPGDSWDDAIRRKLAEADIVIFLVSQTSISSAYVEAEIKLALKNSVDRNTKIIPVLLKNCDWGDSELANFQFLPVNEFGRLTPLNSMVNPEDTWEQLTNVIRDFLDSQEPDYFQRRINKLYNELKIVVHDDLQKLRWGGKANVNGYSLKAKVEKASISNAHYKINISIHSNHQGEYRQVAIFLHNTFSNEINFLKFDSSTVNLEITAYEAFTIGAFIEDGTELELDLMEQSGLPKKFYYKHNFDALWLDSSNSYTGFINTLSKDGITFYQHDSWQEAKNTLLVKEFDFVVSSLSVYDSESILASVRNALNKLNNSVPIVLHSDRNYLNTKQLDPLLRKASLKILLIGNSYRFVNPIIDMIPKNLLNITRLPSFDKVADFLKKNSIDLIVSAIPENQHQQEKIEELNIFNKIRGDTPLVFYSGKRNLDSSLLLLLVNNGLVILNVKIASAIKLVSKIVKEL
ncbi:toll/interleukin-1 receptor domain-containing protein [Dyadobacter sp. 32]|uniref:TIR domain-containing protein n=1 Tax=Dyadobacter sp. 32 TaxID=538966 RepID=UPI0011EE43F6